MAFSATPFALQNGSHSAELFRQAVSSLVPTGGGIVSTGDFNVTQTGTPSMNVSVGVGRIWIPGTNVGNVTGGNFSAQAMYYGQNTAPYTVTIPTSDPVNPRIDVIYAAVNDSQYAGTTDSGVISVASGVPTSGATYPANAPALPANSVALAWINVPANATSIVNSNITNTPTNYPVGNGPRGLIASFGDSSSQTVPYNFLAIISDITTPSIPAGRKLRIVVETDGYMTADGAISAIVGKQGGTTGNDNGTTVRNSGACYPVNGATIGASFIYNMNTTTTGPQRFYVLVKPVSPANVTTVFPANTRRIYIYDDGAA